VIETNRPRARATLPSGASTRTSFRFAVAIQTETLAFWIAPAMTLS
jgi:hypothetical protein